jgi:hypothetical protein
MMKTRNLPNWTRAGGILVLMILQLLSGACGVDAWEPEPSTLGEAASALVQAAGANTPFKSVEAESGTLAGGASVQGLSTPANNNSSPQLEASGHAYVQLDANGEAVTLTTTQTVTALNVRFCIPDSSGGGGITATLNMYVNGVFRQALTLTSAQSWNYNGSGNERHGWSETPSTGNPHIFWDERHFFITGAAVPSGATITFQKDAANSADFYRLDVIDLENPPAALAQPANSLSILDYGAVANNPSFDSQPAIQSCINAAQSQGKSVWIPAGTFYLRNTSSVTLTATGITIEGAGMWYSTIMASPPPPALPNGNILLPTSCTIRNLAFDSTAVHAPGGLNVKGSNWLLEKLWIQHMGAGIWANGTNGIIRDCRTGSTWADGININNGNGAPNNNVGNNLTVTNCFVRGSGDDGIAVNSGGDPGTVQMDYPTVTNNTVVAPWWANNIGIYGGTNVNVSNNLTTDSVGAYGISIGQFGAGGRPLQSGSVSFNTILRGGSYGFYNQAGVHALFVGNTAAISSCTVDGNIVQDSLFQGLGVNLCGSGVVVQNNLVQASGTTGFHIPSSATGSAAIKYNAIIDTKAGQSAYVNSAPGFTANLTANTWHATKKLVVGNTYKLRASNSLYVHADTVNPLTNNAATAGAWEQYQVVDLGGGKIGLRSAGNNLYVSARGAGADPLVASAPSGASWEQFVEIDAGGANSGLRPVVNNKYVTTQSAGVGVLIANRNALGAWETFTVTP